MFSQAGAFTLTGATEGHLVWVNTYNWASTRENLSSVVCEKHRRRPACASAQSDQRLCFSLFGKFHIQTCYKRSINFLASLCSWAGWFESHFVGNPEDRFSGVAAQLSQVTPASSRCVQSLVPILLAGQSLMESSVPTQWTSSSKITPLPIPFPVVLALAPVL